MIVRLIIPTSGGTSTFLCFQMSREGGNTKSTTVLIKTQKFLKTRTEHLSSSDILYVSFSLFFIFLAFFGFRLLSMSYTAGGSRRVDKLSFRKLIWFEKSTCFCIDLKIIKSLVVICQLRSNSRIQGCSYSITIIIIAVPLCIHRRADAKCSPKLRCENSRINGNSVARCIVLYTKLKCRARIPVRYQYTPGFNSYSWPFQLTILWTRRSSSSWNLKATSKINSPKHGLLVLCVNVINWVACWFFVLMSSTG